ncbi:Protein of unknown function [Gryllus bimaculatus]|nr:Protein of unknown function [Gryllus bimaculatus]
MASWARAWSAAAT